MLILQKYPSLGGKELSKSHETLKLWAPILVAELKLPFYYDDDGPEAILIKNGDSFFDRHQTFYPRLVNKNQSTEILFVCYTTYSDRKERKIVVFELSNYLLTISNDCWPEKNVGERKKIETEKVFIPIGCAINDKSYRSMTACYLL